jgi:hypothetical protein
MGLCVETIPATKGELVNAIDLLAFASLTIPRSGFLGGDRSEHLSMEATVVISLLSRRDCLISVSAGPAIAPQRDARLL